jgi:hypothetical protein
MASTTVNGWWQRTWARLSRPAAPTDYFAFDRLDPHARTLQSAVVLLLAVLIAFPTNLFMDGDTGWHLGRYWDRRKHDRAHGSVTSD